MNEFLVGIPLLVVLMGLGLSAVPLVLAKARLTEAIWALVPVKQELLVDYAVTGRWPQPSPSTADSPVFHSALEGLEGIEAPGGAIHLRLDVEKALHLAPGRLGIEGRTAVFSLIRADREDHSAHFPLWVCGHGTPPDGFRRVSPVSPSHLPRDLLPPVCKI